LFVDIFRAKSSFAAYCSYYHPRNAATSAYTVTHLSETRLCATVTDTVNRPIVEDYSLRPSRNVESLLLVFRHTQHDTMQLLFQAARHMLF